MSRCVRGGGAFSARSLRTLAAFGLTVADVGLDSQGRTRAAARAGALAERLLGELSVRGGVAVMTGPSGSGKSSVLRAVGEGAPGRGMRAVWARGPGALASCRRRAVDVVATEAGGRAGAAWGALDALRTLAACGLADARLGVTRACELSEGERARLALARALAACGRCPERAGALPLMLVDELGASLDDVTARAVGVTLGRALAARGLRAVVVTHRPDLAAALGARVVVELPAAWLLGNDGTEAAVRAAGSKGAAA